MDVSLEWLQDFVEVPAVDAVCDSLRRAGVEVEAVRDPRTQSRGVIVGEVLVCTRHPHAEKLTVCEVSDGRQSLQVICGADNVAVGQKVALAPVGAQLQNDSRWLAIELRELRGIESQGMLCSRAELGLERKSSGLWVLPTSARLGADVFSVLDVRPVLTVAITPNRPDLLCHLGIARELAAATGQRLKSAAGRLSEKGPEVTTQARVVVQDQAGCRRYVARVIQGLGVGPSPQWLQQRLEEVGQRSINNLVDATNYVLFELGQPLHTFDLSRIAIQSGLPTVVVRRAAAGERLRTLEGVERELRDEDLVIADATKALALAGVMGGADSEVSAATTAVLLESASFDAVSIRRTSRRHDLRSESSYRFERGTDPGLAVRAADRCAQLLAEIADGQVCKGRIDVAAKNNGPLEIRLRLNQVPRLLGVDLSPEATVQLLEPLEIRCTARNDRVLHFEVPTFRPDLRQEVDLIEELARRRGYDELPESLPSTVGSAAESASAQLPGDAARAALLASGCSEAISYAFGAPEVFRAAVGDEPVRILNPMGEAFSALRTSLLPGLLLIAQHNQRHGQPHGRLFEIGHSFHRRVASADEDARDRDLPREVLRAGCIIWGGRHRERWYAGGAQVDFFDASGIAENIVESYDVAGTVAWVAARHACMNPYATANVLLDGHPVGTVGHLHPDWATRFDLQGPLFAVEMDLDTLAAQPQRRVGHRDWSRYPGSRRDVAVIVGREIHAGAIRRYLLEHAGGALGRDVVEAVQLFDVYDGKPVPKDKVSLAFAISYRSAERTLTDAEISAAFAAAIEGLTREFSAELRA